MEEVEEEQGRVKKAEGEEGGMQQPHIYLGNKTKGSIRTIAQPHTQVIRPSIQDKCLAPYLGCKTPRVAIILLTCTTQRTGQRGAPPPMLIPIILFFPLTSVTDRDMADVPVCVCTCTYFSVCVHQHMCAQCVQSRSQTIFRYAGKIGLVNGLFRSRSFHRNVEQSNQVALRK